jgi:hypothetical protein
LIHTLFVQKLERGRAGSMKRDGLFVSSRSVNISIADPAIGGVVAIPPLLPPEIT